MYIVSGTSGIMKENTRTKKEARSRGMMDDPGEMAVFPRHTKWIVFCLTLAWRLHYVTQKINWWILHPDETYQILEVAHSELYGYGFRPYEYLPPPSANETDMTIALAQEHALGMYSFRSFLIPKLFVCVAWLSDSLGFHGCHIMIWKLFHTSIASTLPLSMYSFSRVVLGSRDAATLTSIFVALSVHMNVFATHTLIQSFLSPFVFFALTGLIKPFMKEKETDKTDKSADVSKKNWTPRISSDINGNAVKDVRRKSSVGFSVNKNHERCNGIHYCKNIRRYNTTTQSILKNNLCYDTMKSAFVIGLCVYIRPDVSVTTTLICIPFILQTLWDRHEILNRQYLLSSAVGIISALYTGIFDDVISYRTFVVTPWQWLKFNVLSTLASQVFGASETSFYINKVFMFDASSSVLFVIFVVCLYIQTTKKTTGRPITLRLLFTTSALLLTYSYHGHKELRFIHDFFPMLFILYTSSFYDVYRYMYTKDNKHHRMTVCILLFLFASSQFNAMPSSDEKSRKEWTYFGTTDSNHVNICLDFISQQSDVSGVFLDRNIHMTGGYSLIHQNVSLMTLIYKEFKEFDDTDSRFRSASALFPGQMVSLSVFSKVANFISVHNTPYLLKILLHKEKYNYLVIKKDRQFIDYGYKEVFTSGNMRVLRRSFYNQDELKMADTASMIPVGSDIKIMNYEARWLLTYDLLSLAEEKLVHSLKIGPNKLQTMALLMEVYRRQNKTEDINRLFKYCENIHGYDMCILPPVKDVIHEEYEFMSQILQ